MIFFESTYLARLGNLKSIFPGVIVRNIFEKKTLELCIDRDKIVGSTHFLLPNTDKILTNSDKLSEISLKLHRYL